MFSINQGVIFNTNTRKGAVGAFDIHRVVENGARAGRAYH